MLGSPDTQLMTYPVETAIAGKLETMVALDTTNSRMKDFSDWHWLATHFNLEPATVRSAVENTCARRGTPLPTKPPVACTNAFQRCRRHQIFIAGG